MNSLEFKGSNVSVSELLNDGRNTFISGYFSEHITFGFNSIYSNFQIMLLLDPSIKTEM